MSTQNSGPHLDSGYHSEVLPPSNWLCFYEWSIGFRKLRFIQLVQPGFCILLWKRNLNPMNWLLEIFIDWWFSKYKNLCEDVIWNQWWCCQNNPKWRLHMSQRKCLDWCIWECYLVAKLWRQNIEQSFHPPSYVEVYHHSTRYSCSLARIQAHQPGWFRLTGP